MNPSDLDPRTAASLHRRLLAAPKEVRAVAIAEAAEWHLPEFAADDREQEAMHTLLRACCDARAAVYARLADNVDDAGRSGARVRRLAAAERLTALERAIAGGVRAGRMLRQRGLKTTLTTRDRFDADEAVLAHAELGFRRRRMTSCDEPSTAGRPTPSAGQLAAGDGR